MIKTFLTPTRGCSALEDAYEAEASPTQYEVKASTGWDETDADPIGDIAREIERARAWTPPREIVFSPAEVIKLMEIVNLLEDNEI
jgi:hypothetical protein